MSQQEFMPESQHAREEAQDNEEINSKSYSQYRTSDMPKRDHPADFENALPIYSYPAQDQQQSQTQSNAQQGTGTYQSPHYHRQSGIEEQLKRAGRRFYEQQQRRFERARSGQQSYAPPLANSRMTANRTPAWLIVLLVAIGFLVLLPLLLKLLLALFAVLLVLAVGAIFVIIFALLISAIMLKKRWQRSRWRYGPPLRHGRMRYNRWRRWGL